MQHHAQAGVRYSTCIIPDRIQDDITMQHRSLLSIRLTRVCGRGQIEESDECYAAL